MTVKKAGGRRTDAAPDRDLQDEASRGVPGMLLSWPGTRAAVDVVGIEPDSLPGDEHLVMLLDPLNLSLTPSPQPDGRSTMVRFLRELVDAATRMADHLDASGALP
jgi:hypothetical protein